MIDKLLKVYVKRFQGLRNDEGQDLVEYALLVALIALVCISSIQNIATSISTVFNTVSSSLA